MRKLILPYLCIIYLAVLNTSCREPYTASIDNVQKEILVIEGQLTDAHETCVIRVTKAINFNDKEYTYDSKVNIVSNAQLSITDNKGKLVNLVYVANGYYTADASKIQGVVGNSYTLRVKMADGTVYESNPETILHQAASGLLYAEDMTKDVMETMYDGSIFYSSKKGKEVFADVLADENKPYFFKFETRMIKEMIQYEWRSGRVGLVSPTPVYYWNVSSLEDKPMVKSTFEKNGQSLIKKLDLGFMDPEVPYTDPKDTLRDPFFLVGWVLSSHILSISEAEYNFYSKLNEQLSASNKIFDPLPTQLYSNMKCTTDASKIVLGYFGVSAKLKNDMFFNTTRVSRDIVPLPDNVLSGVIDSIPPAHWRQ